MPFSSDHEVLALIKTKDNEKAKALIKKGRLYNAIDPSRNRLLHYAAEYENPEIVQFLLDSGSKVNARNNLLQTPLMKSFKSKLPCKQVIEILLRAGADIDIESRDRQCVLNTINCRKWLNADTRRYEILKFFLERARNLDHFPLLEFGDEECIKSLLQTNVNLHKTDAEGKTIVHILATNHYPGVIDELHSKNYNVDVRNNFGRTPLMLAAVFGLVSSVEFLLSEGADVNATDESKKTALCFAIGANSGDEGYGDLKGTVQVLLEHGANVQVEMTDDGNNSKTVFDHLLKYSYESDFEVMELMVAHLALQEVLGTAITDLIRSKIHSNDRLKSHLENCQQQLSRNMYSSITLLDLLTASERKLERYFCNKELASKLICFQANIEYFDTILKKRFAKASRMVKLRKTAGQIMCKLMKTNCLSYPFVTSEIVNYFNEKDIECLISIQNDIP